MSRSVRLVLCRRDGDTLGALPPLAVPTPWWPDVEPVVRAARDRFGIDVVVLRLLAADGDAVAMGGAVTYLAELAGPVPAALRLTGVAGDGLRDHPLRAAWARPGGVAATLAWADDVLTSRGRPRTGPAVQVKSWNLSLILRLPTAQGPVWCKQVPPFLAHEGAIIAMVGDGGPAVVPPLVAADPANGRVLLGHVPGEDQWQAPEKRLERMVRLLVGLQAGWASRTGALVAAGLPDWGATRLPALIDRLLERPETHAALETAELRGLGALAAQLPSRLAVVAGCGLPETLVHGDFHAGNVRSDGRSLVLLDWGDSGVGHPLLDMPAFLSRVTDAARRGRLRAAWLEAWRTEMPGSDPAAAAALLGPVAALRQAVVYRRFLDGIEPDERRYHEADVPLWLRRALTTAA